MQKMKFQFGGLIRRVDLSDVEFVSRYEQAVSCYERGVEELDRNLAPSAQLEQVCGLFFTLFDQLFGSGSSQEMFGGTKSVALCTKAFSALLRTMDKYARQLSHEGAGA